MELLIKDGKVIDGSGAPAQKLDILIKNGKILKIAPEIESSSSKTIDAGGRYVCPGFIDIHNHADLTILEENKAEAYVMQGITTILAGVCGIGVYPTNKTVKKYYYNFVSKAFCTSPDLYEDLNQFSQAFETIGLSVNIGLMIPQGNVRACVMGTETRSADQSELNQMKQLIRENMEFGAFGLSTGLVYPPGSTTSTEELIEITKVVSEYNGFYDSHMRNEGAGVIDIGMKELLQIAKEAKVRAHISHWSVISRFKYEELTKQAIKLVNDSRKDGLHITADMTVYDDGFTSLSFVLLPTWVYDDFKGNLSHKETRELIKKEIFEKLYSMFLSDAPIFMKLLPKFLLRKKIVPILSRGVIVIYALHNHEVEGKTLYEVLTKLYPEKKLEDALLDYFLDEEGGIMIRIQQKNEELSMIPIFKHPYVAPSTDAVLIIGGNTHPRAYGAFPRAIARWVREKRIFSIEEMVKKMTSLPASILSLPDRGLLKEGYNADIVIFNLEEINETGTLENGCSPPKGIDYVIVNGVITVYKGEHSGALNGQFLKHQI